MNATSILENIYENMNPSNGWTLLDNINPSHYDILNELEDLNLIISKEDQTLFKIKNNLVVSVCCQPLICKNQKAFKLRQRKKFKKERMLKKANFF